MKDTQLYSEILGIRKPWKVVNVQVSLADDEVQVTVGRALAANSHAQSVARAVLGMTNERGAGAIWTPVN